MQTIQTIYSNGNIRAKCWNGWTRIEWEPAFSSEANHRAAAQKLVDKLNACRFVAWEITASAPGVPGVRNADGGWIFIIDYKQDVAPLHMSITVRFMPSTNTGPAYMKAHSWLNPKGRKVDYSAHIGDSSDLQACARYAATMELERINSLCRVSGDLIGYKLGDYVQTYTGDRLFTLVSGDK